MDVHVLEITGTQDPLTEQHKVKMWKSSLRSFGHDW